MPSSVARILALVISAVIGGVYGTAATVAHSYALGWFPLGLVLASIGCGALLLALRLLTGDRWAALGAGIGMLGVMILFANVSRGGSHIVAPQSPQTQWVALAWTLIVPSLVALVVSWPDLSKLPRPERPNA